MLHTNVIKSLTDFLTFRIILTGLKQHRLKWCKFLNWPDFCFFDVTSIQVSSIQSSTYQRYTVRITPYVLIIIFKKMLLHCEVSYLLWRNFIQITILALFKILIHPIAQRLSGTFYRKNWNPDLLLTQNCHPLLSWFWSIRLLLLERGKRKNV